ncbi:MAG: hypothetical protein [Bacteriophage sp.]|nr:MAG: hypothetical protein [Bacteriophage sp.]UVX32629.1 MAG: hypothetical protein [Bacteriophage sp.]UVX84061.1 MAG: hypothetical protein [Bacteriophage sp.]UWI15999.1 MAG: hypothetical protein [Bacteriophage sp.]
MGTGWIGGDRRIPYFIRLFYVSSFRKNSPTGIMEPKLTPERAIQPPESKEISLHKGNRMNTGRVSIDIHK